MISRSFEPDLSIIVPVFNEQAALPLLFSALESQNGIRLEIIFSDGQSTDASVALIADFQRRSRHMVELVQGERGRACQLNRGAHRARSATLLFLHCDSGWDDPDFLRHAWEAFSRHRRQSCGLQAGHFSLAFSHTQPRHQRFYRYLAAKAGLGLPGTVFGDQGLMIEQPDWQQLGGYEETLPVLEDVEIIERITASGRLLLLPGVLTTSSRRYQQDGLWRRQALNALLLLVYWSGQSRLLPCVMGSYLAESNTPCAVMNLAGQLHQLSLSAYCSFWYGCGSAVVRYFWLIPYRLYWWFGTSSPEARQIVDVWQRQFLPLISGPVINRVIAAVLFVTFYCVVLFRVPWCAGRLFRHLLTDDKGETHGFGI